MPERIGVDRLCEILGRPKRVIQYLAARGDIPSAMKVGRVWTFREAAVRSWIAEREARVGPPLRASSGSKVSRLSPQVTVQILCEEFLGLREKRPSGQKGV
jgi:predicted DNA-binding transcriptional regulator AlpA